MPSAENLLSEVSPHSLIHTIKIDGAGLVLGARTCLVRMRQSAHGSKRLALEEDGSRLLALLSVLKGHSVSIDILRTVEAVSNDWERGDKALANIRLAQANLPKLADGNDAYRLLLAEEALDKGVTPSALMKALGLDASHFDLIRYDQNQPRVPAGDGRESGRWGSGGSSSESFTPFVSISEANVRPPSPQVRAEAAQAPPALIVATAATGVSIGVGEFGVDLFAAVEGGAFLTALGALGAMLGQEQY